MNLPGGQFGRAIVAGDGIIALAFNAAQPQRPTSLTNSPMRCMATLICSKDAA